MKKVIFKSYRQYSALICGLFLIMGSILMIGVFVFVPTNLPLLGIIQCCFVPILFFIMGFVGIFYSYIYPKTGIKEIIIYNSNILLTAYNEEKKEYTLDIPKSEILSCNVNIRCTKDYEVLSNALDILVDFSIACKDSINHRIEFHTEDYHKIKQIFSVAKYFPNFSYKVDTNFQEFQANIINLAKTGKNLPPNQYLSAYFDNPNTPDWQKKLFKVLIILITCYTIFLLAFVIKLFLKS